MVTVNAMRERWKKVKIETLMNESFEETADDYADTNADQMYAGKLNDGEKIEPPYTPLTKKIKKRKGQPTNRVTLRDTNDFQNQLTATRQGKKIKIKSPVEYAKHLEKKYTKNIYGLNDKYRAKYQPIFYGVMKSKVTGMTGLKFTN